MSPDSPTGTEKLRAWAEIDRSALANNARTCAGIAGPMPLLAVVKANGYGHGINEVVKALAPLPETWGFGVANLAEAQSIANAVADPRRILILGPVLPAEREAMVASGFAVEVSNADEARAFSEIAERSRKTLAVHVTVDTGMGRMGIFPDQFLPLLKNVRDLEWVDLAGVATHLPSADEDSEFTREQIKQFLQLVKQAELPESVLVHVANSAGVMAFANALDETDLARVGLALYGVSSVESFDVALVPALRLKSRITLVRDLPAGHSISYGRTFITEKPTTVATIGIGYGDGYPRSLSGNGAEVLIAGQRCPLLGRVTMDQIMVDVGGLEERPQPGDEVELIGGEIVVTEIAEKAGTIAWEVFTGITQRVTRVYR